MSETGSCIYLGSVRDPLTHSVQAEASHRCFATEPRSKIDLPTQRAHCFADARGCPRYLEPVAGGMRAAPVPIDLPEGAELETAGRSGRDGRLSAAGLVGRLRERSTRFSFEDAVVVGTSVALLAAVAYFGLFVKPDEAESSLLSRSVAASATWSAGQRAEEPTQAPTITPRPTRVSIAGVAATAPVPTPVEGGQNAALTPSERGVASFSRTDRVPIFGQRELRVGTFDGNRFIGGLLFALDRIPPTSRINYVALELAGLSDANALPEGQWRVELLEPQVAERWGDLTFEALVEAPATKLNQEWVLRAGDVEPRRVNVLQFDDSGLEQFRQRMDDRRIAFRISGPDDTSIDNLFIWDSGFGEGFGTRPVLRVSFVAPTPTPAPERGRGTDMPLIVWTPEPTASATPTSTPSDVPAELRGKILFRSDRFGGDGRLMVLDPTDGRVGQVTQGWVLPLARARETTHEELRVLVHEVPCGGGFVLDERGRPVLGDDGEPLPNPDPARRCAQIAIDDGSGQPPREVTEPGYTHYDPVFSPDGQWLAYVSQVGNDEVFKIRVDGTQNTRLTDNDWEWDKHPSYSPDGNRIVFWSNREGRRQLYVMDADGGQVEPLAPSQWNDWDPVWVK